MNDSINRIVSHPFFTILLVAVILFNTIRIFRDLLSKQKIKKRIKIEPLENMDSEPRMMMEPPPQDENNISKPKSSVHPLRTTINKLYDNLGIKTNIGRYMYILNDSERFFDAKILQTLLQINHNDEGQMMKNIDLIEKYKIAKNSIDDARSSIYNYAK